MNEGQRPFLWLPGELPCFLQSSDCVQYDATGASFAHRVEGNVPIFRESISFGTIADRRLGLAASSSHEPAPSEFEDLFEPPVEGKAEAREIIDDEAPDGKAARLIKEASSVSHRLGHFPKNPYCRICVQARMWGGLAETEAFGDRVAADLVVITKSSKDEKESTVLVVRDEHTGYVRAFPFFRKLTENIVLCLLQFVGSHADKGPTVVFKSDNAKELESACNQMSWIPEPTLPNKWPHNSNLERDIRTIEEVTRAVHLQSGFQIRPGLWVHSCAYAAFVLNLKHTLKGSEHTRYIAAVGSEFSGRQLLLGQLVFYRTDPKSRAKYEPSAAPALFAGWRLDSGPGSFKGVYQVLDYQKVIKTESASYALAISVPTEELWVPEGEPVFPMRQAFEQALEGFSDPKCPELKGLEIPFSPLSVDSVPAERQRYVTLGRIIKYGPTPGCKGCTFDSRRHTPICKVRFDGLVRADKAAEARVEDKGLLELPRPDEVEDEIIDPEPKPYDGEPSDAEGPDAAVSEHTPSLHDYRDAEPGDDDDVDYSLYVPSEAEDEPAAVNIDLRLSPNSEFLSRDREIRRAPGSRRNPKQLVEYSCGGSDELGLAAHAHDVDCLRIGE